MSFKLSRYLIQDNASGENQVSLFSVRSGKALSLRQDIYRKLASRDFSGLPGSMLLKLLELNILVPAIEDERTAIVERNIAEGEDLKSRSWYLDLTEQVPSPAFTKNLINQLKRNKQDGTLIQSRLHIYTDIIKKRTDPSFAFAERLLIDLAALGLKPEIHFVVRNQFNIPVLIERFSNLKFDKVELVYILEPRTINKLPDLVELNQWFAAVIQQADRKALPRFSIQFFLDPRLQSHLSSRFNGVRDMQKQGVAVAFFLHHQRQPINPQEEISFYRALRDLDLLFQPMIPGPVPRYLSVSVTPASQSRKAGPDYSNPPVDKKKTLTKARWQNENFLATLTKGKIPCSSCSFLPVCGGADPSIWKTGIKPCPTFTHNLFERIAIARKTN